MGHRTSIFLSDLLLRLQFPWSLFCTCHKEDATHRNLAPFFFFFTSNLRIVFREWDRYDFLSFLWIIFCTCCGFFLSRKREMQHTKKSRFRILKKRDLVCKNFLCLLVKFVKKETIVVVLLVFWHSFVHFLGTFLKLTMMNECFGCGSSLFSYWPRSQPVAGGGREGGSGNANVPTGNSRPHLACTCSEYTTAIVLNSRGTQTAASSWADPRRC